MELKTLAKETADFVAEHLVMASALVDTDPELAHQHALSASRRGGRIAMVRETLAITAYLTGDYALALRELRTYRRISGRDDQIALMVDSERGLGRPDRALELGRSVDESKLDTNGKVQLAIAMSGARLDQGNAELALAELEIPQLDRTKAFSYSPALFGAYAAVLTDLGRDKEAAVWERAAELAQNALDESQEGFETVEFVTEPNPDYIPPEEPEDADDETEESEDAASQDADEAGNVEDEPAEDSDESDDSDVTEEVADDDASDDFDEATDEPEVAPAELESAVAAEAVSAEPADDESAAEDVTVAADVLDDDEFTRASVSEQVEAEFAEILAEIDEATEVEAEEIVEEIAEAGEVVEAEDAQAPIEAELEVPVEVEVEAETEPEHEADVQSADAEQPVAKADKTEKYDDESEDDDEDDEQLSLFDL